MQRTNRKRAMDTGGPGLVHTGDAALTELRYIVAVARERHFGRAAEAWRLAAHPVGGLQKLEEEPRSDSSAAAARSRHAAGRDIVRQAQVTLESAASSKTPGAARTRWRPGRCRWSVDPPSAPICCRTWCSTIAQGVAEMPLMLQENFTVRLLEMPTPRAWDCTVLRALSPTPAWRSRRSTTSPSWSRCRAITRWPRASASPRRS